jgi:hypothetical protein
MLCVIDSINVREARRRLYQPELAADAEKRRLHCFSEPGDKLSTLSSSSTTCNRPYSAADILSQRCRTPSTSSESTDTSEKNLSDLQELQGEEEEEEDDDEYTFLNSFSANAPSKLFTTSTKAQVFQSANNLPSLQNQYGSSYDSQDDLIMWRDHYRNLQFCVRLPSQTILLNLEPKDYRQSDNNSYGKNGVGGKKYRHGQGSDTSLLAVMGICSFALPIVGYFLFHSNFSFFQAFS